MNHADLDINTVNTPMCKVKLTKCSHCKGQMNNGFTCTASKDNTSRPYPCSPLFELICPRLKEG